MKTLYSKQIYFQNLVFILRLKRKKH